MAKPTHFHDYITVVTDIDRKRYGQRIVPMKVLCLGMDRTGTDCELLFSRVNHDSVQDLY